MPHPILSVEDVSKTYDGFKAISNLTFYLFEGELRTVIGPNGAGSPIAAKSNSAPRRPRAMTSPS